MKKRDKQKEARKENSATNHPPHPNCSDNHSPTDESVPRSHGLDHDPGVSRHFLRRSNIETSRGSPAGSAEWSGDLTAPPTSSLTAGPLHACAGSGGSSELARCEREWRDGAEQGAGGFLRSGQHAHRHGRGE